jgi:UDP-2,3-diacylglucosamine pyrophosphatase LpxH
MIRQPPQVFQAASTTLTHHRSLFLSDLHLGAAGARPQAVLDFLACHRAETLYLVGDIVDHWHGLAGNWQAAHHTLLRALLALPASGTRVVYIPGNHDAFFRNYAGASFQGIDVQLEACHQAADGRRYLLLHGDCCDRISAHLPVIARLGTLVETAAQALDRLHQPLLHRFLHTEWHGLQGLLSQANGWLCGFNHFEERLCDLARARGYDGVICGHFHSPALQRCQGTTYANCGDWLGHCSALAEGFDGSLRLILPAADISQADHIQPMETEGAVSSAR